MKKNKHIFVSLLAFMCISVYGCWHESVEDVSRTKLIGYSGDSLVVYIKEKTEETCLAKPLGDDCSTRELGTHIIVNNFYTQENVWKSPKIKDKYVTHVYDLVDDSTIIEYDRNSSSFYRWRLGEGYEKLGPFDWTGCSMGENVDGIRPWGKGKLRLTGGYSCAYAIVDLDKREIHGYENLDEFAQGCSDIWMFDGKKYCVGLISKDTILSYYECGIKGVFFKEEQNIKDSLWGDQLAENIIYSPDIVRYMNSFLWLETGLIGRHLIRIDYKNGKLVYIRKYL